MENQAHNFPNGPQPTTTAAATTTLGARRSAKDAAFLEKLRYMALPLNPLVQLETSHIHPAFPRTLLHFYLLTDDQLEELAHFYHQRTPCHLTRFYPCPITWSSDLPLHVKRRKIGRFIGLRGCESPVVLRTEEDLLEEARLARLAAEEDLRRKATWY
ncbi:hypothetical protein F4778DRAFT_117086 [Xylariomycetidae sp. FL2044]|nr:hypothetical protein F4778DRAFT_117086 [Xylariomycetidae sp. FL2044]